MKIITISGLDGSGKSTQIEMLKNYLKSQGKKVFYFHAIEFGIAKKIVDFRNKYCLICKLTGKCKVYKEKSVTKAGWLTIQLRKLFLKVDISRFRNLVKKLEKEGYDYLVSDRYFYDSVVNIEYLCHSERPCHSELVSESKNDEMPKQVRHDNSILFNNIKRPDLPIYLQPPPETIMQRERIPDQGLEYLKKKKELYDAKTSIWNWKVIDGNRDKNVIFEEIKSYVA